MQILDEDQYTHEIVYGTGTVHLITQRRSARATSCVIVRILVDPTIPRISRQVHALQDAIRSISERPRRVRGSRLGPAQPQEGARRAAPARRDGARTRARMFGTRTEVDPVRHLIGTAIGWGGNPSQDAMYVSVIRRAERRQDGLSARASATCPSTDSGRSASTTRRATSSRMCTTPYTINNLTAKPPTDGTIVVQFGGDDRRPANCLPIMPGWNYLVRMYRPRAEVLDGHWTFPDAHPVK